MTTSMTSDDELRRCYPSSRIFIFQWYLVLQGRRTLHFILFHSSPSHEKLAPGVLVASYPSIETLDIHLLWIVCRSRLRIMSLREYFSKSFPRGVASRRTMTWSGSETVYPVEHGTSSYHKSILIDIDRYINWSLAVISFSEHHFSLTFSLH